MTDQHTAHTNILALTAKIVTAHVSNNRVAVVDIQSLISQVHASLTVIANGVSKVKLEPAVPINKSIKPDVLVCLEDGTEHKMLKRHLRNIFNMTPDEYREKWGLPDDYPMVCPNYSKVRSKLAKKSGLGTKTMRTRTAKSKS